MDKLLKSQALLLRAIVNAETNFRKLGKDNFTYAKAKNRLETLKENWAKFQDQHVELELLADQTTRTQESYYTKDCFSTAEDAYLGASDFILAWILSLDPKQSKPPSQDASTLEQLSLHRSGFSFNLPTIELPTFSGNYRDWEGFRDRFTSLVINEKSLSNVRKMHYLSSCLRDTASDSIKMLQITDANFAIAWNTLTSRYENKRRLIQVHLNSFFSMSNVTSGSVNELRALRDQSNICIQSLKNLGRPVDSWDDILVFCVSQRLDLDSRRAWELKLGDSLDYPNFEKLNKFLDSRIRALESIGPTSCGFENRVKKDVRKSSSPIQSHNSSQAPPEKCPVCNGPHFIIHCTVFKNKSPSQRFVLIKQYGRCINCFSSRHGTKECKNPFCCRKCQKKHHTLLHFDAKNISTEASSSENPSAPVQEDDSINPQISVNLMSSRTKVLLATAWIQVSSPSGRKQNIRALLDQGSEATFVSESVAQNLRAPLTRVNINVSGIGGAPAGIARYSTRLEIKPCEQEGPGYMTNALILPSLTNYVPHRATNLSTWTHVNGLKLADPNIQSSVPIQMIIGADLYGSLLLDGVRKGPVGQPVAQKTIFGWVLSGSITSNCDQPASIRVHFSHEAMSLDQELKRFWEVEELPPTSYLTKEEIKCEEHFVTSHSRSSNGQYIVRLPFKEGPPIAIGESEYKARAMFNRLERQLHQKPKLAADYASFMQEYKTLGHMIPVAPHQRTATINSPVYLPHHAVVREESLTTKLRVVFNASITTSNGSSLNDHLLIGPRLQPDLPSLILHWRKYKYVYSADIAKMYRQILIDKRDVDFQRILWRTSPDSDIQEYQLLTVTYGTASAPFLAIRVLQQLATDEGEEYPLAASILRKDTYIDDCLFGANTIERAKVKREQLNNLLAQAHFTLRKWASNCSALLEDISPESHGLACPKTLDNEINLKILGIFWNPANDTFQFQVHLAKTIPQTKRAILSVIAKLFDPVGWVTPVVITAKIFMQRLWLLKNDWDECLSTELFNEWKRYYLQLPQLNHLTLRRWTEQGDFAVQTEIHGFSDASNVAYAAVAYLRVILQSGKIITSLLTSKSKVAPIKPMSVPRLELSGAVLLVKLITFIQNAMNLHNIPCYCWTDSTIVLAWVKQHPSRWATFVANRVALIQTQLPCAEWRHVPTHDNPADCSSRGIAVDELKNHQLWWHGPKWLRHPDDMWPRHPSIDVDQQLLEEKRQVSVLSAIHHESWDLSTRISSWPRLLRVTAYVLRFIDRCRQNPKSSSMSVSPFAINSTEFQRSKIFWLRYIQRELFFNEISDLFSDKPICKNSSLVSLNPLLDSDGLLRVGGRLENSPLSYQSKHPIILKSHALVSLIVRYTHLRNYHAGPLLTLSLLRNEYWILRARQVVRSIIYKCIECVREKASSPTQLMGQLPGVRVTASSRAFLHSGIDYAGPFLVRSAPGRGFKTHKTYVAVFVCVVTRAIHIELVNGYTTESFLAAFHRFCSRRGLPTSMYSDNGTTFRGADRELARSFKMAMRDPQLLNHIAADNISWHFIPPASPHFGGLWEAGVKSVKYHLKRVVGAHTLTYEEFTTLLTQVEACLNSRPLAPLSDHVDDYTVLTPGHFLIGSAITVAPAPTMLEINENRLNRWELVRQMIESLWKRWSEEYLHTLQQRSKWRFAKNNVQPGTLVLIRNPLAPPCKWELGRIIECFPGTDNLTRVVKIKTAHSEFKRPLSKICIMPVDINSESAKNALTAGGSSPNTS